MRYNNFCSYNSIYITSWPVIHFVDYKGFYRRSLSVAGLCGPQQQVSFRR